MRHPLFKFIVLPVCAALLIGSVQAYEVLELPAVRSDLALTSPLFGVTKAGKRLVAVGIRGHILLSDDSAQSWRQAQQVPVRSDLLDVEFVSDKEGWAVGHDSVILHTTDGGENWEKQFDGLTLGATGVKYYQKKLEEAEDALAGCGDDDADKEELQRCEELEVKVENYGIMVGEMEFAAEQGADKPFFSIVCYLSSCNAGGAYGLNYRTDDGGKNWVPVLENVGNPEFGHLYDAYFFDGNKEALVGGEMGTVWRVKVTPSWEMAAEEWRYIKLNYEGSLFAVAVAADNSLLAGGLRGNLFRSTDDGEIWKAVDKPKTASLVDGIRLQDGRIVFISQNGQVIVSTDNGATFTAVAAPNRYGFVSLIENKPGQLVIVGNKGPSILNLDKQ